jgi:hypothetical protein
MKPTIAVAPLALTIGAGLIAVPGTAQRAPLSPDMNPMAQAKHRALADVDVRAFRQDGSRMTQGDEGGTAGALLQNWVFEPAPASPAFIVGPLNGQNTWQTFTGGTACGGLNTNATVVSIVPPAIDGAQWVDINVGACPQGTFNGPFGPTSPAQPPGQYTMRCKIRISNTGGADYDVIPQAPSQGFLSARVKFFYGDFDADTIPGDILVLNDPDGAGPMPLAFVGTGAHYTPNTTMDLRVELDNTAGNIKYYINGTLIFTGNIVAGTSIEQVVIPSDNFQLPGEKGQVDDINFEPGITAGCLGDSNSSGAVDVNDLLAVVSHWGPCPAPCPPSCTGDLVPAGGNCVVDVNDLLLVISHWGPCP